MMGSGVIFSPDKWKLVTSVTTQSIISKGERSVALARAKMALKRPRLFRPAI
jgi:hypothetical protein